MTNEEIVEAGSINTEAKAINALRGRKNTGMVSTVRSVMSAVDYLKTIKKYKKGLRIPMPTGATFEPVPGHRSVFRNYRLRIQVIQTYIAQEAFYHISSNVRAKKFFDKTNNRWFGLGFEIRSDYLAPREIK